MRKFELKKRYAKSELELFATHMMQISNEIGFKVSSRGWCYILEGYGFIDKSQFDKVDKLINECRRNGFLPIDFVATEKAREFDGIELPADESVVSMFGRWLKYSMDVSNYYTPDWWDGEEYYIQAVVEKVDLVTLFGPICQEYHIPIANSKGWSSMLQRAEYARRFSEARDKGLKCVLLYAGDHDPDGLRISQFLYDNLDGLKNITWEDGTTGFDPEDLIIDRFGLNYDFILANNLTWIDNLMTGGGELAKLLPNGKIVAGLKREGTRNPGQAHQNFKLPYLQEYLKNYGVRKCEANAIVTHPDSARQLVRDAIEKYLGTDAPDRFRAKREAVRQEFQEFLAKNKLVRAVNTIINKVDKHVENE